MKKFFQDKTILITGHTGFKGSWLTLWLKHFNANVIGFSLSPPTEPNLFTIANVANGIESIIGDIRDYAAIHKVIHDFQPDIVFHLAAQPLVLQSYEQPLDTYTTNVLGTLHLFEALRHSGKTKAIINVTTDKCYENRESMKGYQENDPLGGYDPYSNSKACSELVTSAYRDSFFLKQEIGIATARAGNVIGGGDWAQHRLIPDIIQGCMQQQMITLRHPNALRPWQHVLEPLSGYLQLAQYLYENPQTFSSPWNFGPELNDIKTVEWICDYIIKQWGNKAGWQMSRETNQHHETLALTLDVSKAKNKLHWQPKWNLETSLNKTIEWYKAFQAKQNMREVTLAQIESYLS